MSSFYIMKNVDYRIFLDLDGVLVDYDGGIVKLVKGRNWKDIAAKHGKEAAEKQYLDAILSSPDFWANLDWIEGGKELWDASNNLFERVNILSSAGEGGNKAIEEGKRIWVRKNIPEMNSSGVFIVFGKHLKIDYASKDSILVDDVWITINRWTKAGGYGIHHYHSDYRKTIEDLEDIARPLNLSELAKRYYH